MNIACYCRVSTEKESQIDSLENQKEFFIEYAKKNNHNLIKLYADEGLSGTKLKNRKQFQELISDAKLGIFNMVVVKDVSRFARNTVDLLQNVRTLKELNINVNFITSDMNTLGESEFILTIFGALAQEESANISKRIKFAKNMNAEKGRVPNQVYGYDKVNGEYFDLKINEDESNIVKQIFDMYVNLKYGAYKISMKLNEKGYKTKRGCQWSQNAINRILKNQIYIGKIINRKQEIQDFLTGKRIERNENDWCITEKPELLIIDKKTFEKAQNTTIYNNEKFCHFNKKKSTKNLFSTLIKCKECGYSFRRMEKIYKNTYIRWCCSGRNKSGSGFCENKTNIDEEELLTIIINHLKGTIQNKNEIIEYIKNQQKLLSKNNKSNLENLTKELNKQQKLKDKIIIMYNNDVITIDELKQKSTPINNIISKIESEIKLLKNQSNENTENTIQSQFSLIEDLLKTKNFDNSKLKEIIEIIIVDKNGEVEIQMKF